MPRDRGPQPQPSPPDDDPTWGTSWGVNGSDMQAFRNSLEREASKLSWDGDGNSGGGGGGGGGGCLLISGLIGGAGIAAAFFGAKYGIGA